ncbi:sulfurtransferase [Candidatus Methylacidiphilum fumarolicum]|uniref:Rhodanese-related sulfurtransferase n=2 Tax=Candidatus Methylacidiphilum fumarolicum TaxID=591154 RepID=I0K156_METFB|nr:rhodanese-like domain-containing protein [Candidatus Methylacidiphilum fumarolicum]TFE66150.1 sulfurtransferase [Candidatus Methylacidiphilum fumarolicum]TFE76503.1 sulfurtransferase [Candidatus Methylacidiphilum fumarolicum]CAI9086744.1 Rhodanese-related sulfurtransferase [Candidatus Methylacidiphilum fumarolicum]CCG93225.1 Rhodanese-related sulfurtransferase [Methylacidiphilum fumariolicum SolV]
MNNEMKANKNNPLPHSRFNAYLEKIKRRLKSITLKDTFSDLQNKSGLVIDVRKKEDWFMGHIPGAIWIERSKLEKEVENIVPQSESKIICYGEDGAQSILAAYTLNEMGYINTYWMEKGWEGWKEKKYPIRAAEGIEMRDPLEKLGGICYLPRLFDKIKGLYSSKLPPTEYLQDDWDKAILELLCIDATLLEQVCISSENEQKFLMELKKILGPSWPSQHMIDQFNERCQLRKITGFQKPQFWFWRVDKKTKK